MRLKYITFAIIPALLFCSCSSSMKIDSDPQGARVYINREYKGDTPYVYTDKKVFWTELDVTLKKENYKDFNILIRKNEGDINTKAGCGALVCLPIWGLPFVLWVFDYPAEKKYELEPLNKNSDE